MKIKKLVKIMLVVVILVLGFFAARGGANGSAGCNTDWYYTLKGAGLIDFSAFAKWGEDVAQELMHYGFYLGRGNVAAVTKALLGRAYLGESVGAIAKEIADAQQDMSPDIGSKTTQGDVIVKFQTPLGLHCAQAMKGRGVDFPFYGYALGALILGTGVLIGLTSRKRPQMVI